MSRLPPLRFDDLDDDGRALWQAMVGPREAELTNDEGGLVGPFNAWLHAPDVGRRVVELGALLRFGTSLPRELTELAIVTVGARWRAEFEWWAHVRMARRHGVPEAVLEAIAVGDEPPLASDEERAVYLVARQLAETGTLDEPAWQAASARFGHRALVELVTLCGYYTLVSFTLNAFAVPLPPGVPSRWPSAAGGDGAEPPSSGTDHGARR